MKLKVGFFSRYLVGKITALKAVAAALVMVLLCVSLPASVVGAVSRRWFSAEGKASIQETGGEAVEIVGEDRSKRGYNEKSFVLEDGEYLKQVYAEDVHYFDVKSNGFKEIDNTLREEDGVYTNSANSFKVGLAKDAAADKLITVAERGVSLSMSLLTGAKPQTAEPRNAALSSGLQSGLTVAGSLDARSAVNIESANNVKFRNGLDRFLLLDSLEKVTAKADYARIYPGVNLEYILRGRSLKENIVVTERQISYDYAFKIEVGDGVLLLENGAVNVYDITGDKVFTIPKGYMYDGNGEFSGDVTYELSGQDGSYILSVKADKEWINARNRAFPVTIDPTIQGVSHYAYKTYWYSVETRYDYDRLMVQWDTHGINSREYGMLRFSDDAFYNITPELITDAKLTLTRKSFSHMKWSLFGGWKTNTASFKVYNNYYQANDWNNLSNVSNFTNATYINVSEGSSEKDTFTVTQYAKLAAGGQNYGIALNVDESSASNRKIEYYAAFGGSVPLTSLPTLSITYTPYQAPSISGGAASAGKGEFDLKTGELILTADDIVFTGGVLPLSVSRVFGRGTASGVGTNFRLNLSQTLTQSGSAWVYTAADGLQYTFTNGVNDELNAALSVSSQARVITMYNKNQIVFDTAGKLTEINDGYGHAIALTYDSSGRLYKLTDSAQREIYFRYEGERLEGIYKEASFGTAMVQYGNAASNGTLGRLTTVAYSSDTENLCSYEYDSSGRMTKAKDNDGAYAAYSYPAPPTNAVSFVRNVKEVFNSAVLSDTTVSVTKYTKTVNTETILQRLITVTDNLKGISSFYEYLGDNLHASTAFNSTDTKI